MVVLFYQPCEYLNDINILVLLPRTVTGHKNMFFCEILTTPCKSGIQPWNAMSFRELCKILERILCSNSELCLENGSFYEIVLCSS